MTGYPGHILKGYSVFDMPEGIKNSKYAANHNIATRKI